MARNGRTDMFVNKRITLLQQKIIGWKQIRNLHEAETAVLCCSVNPKSL